VARVTSARLGRPGPRRSARSTPLDAVQWRLLLLEFPELLLQGEAFAGGLLGAAGLRQGTFQVVKCVPTVCASRQWAVRAAVGQSVLAAAAQIGPRTAAACHIAHAAATAGNSNSSHQALINTLNTTATVASTPASNQTKTRLRDQPVLMSQPRTIPSDADRRDERVGVDGDCSLLSTVVGLERLVLSLQFCDSR